MSTYTVIAPFLVTGLFLIFFIRKIMNKKSGIEDFESEMWEKIEKQSELQGRIDSEFLEYDYIIGAREYEKYLAMGIENLKNSINKLNVTSRAEVKKCYFEFKYNIFTIFSLNLTLITYLFKESKKIGAEKDFKQLILDFKESGAGNLFNVVRNRMQHGAILGGEFKYNFQTAHHPEGEKLEGFFEVNSDEWIEIREGCNIVGKTLYDSKIKDSKDKIITTFEIYLEKYRKLLVNIEQQFCKTFSNGMKEREKLIDDIDKIEEWLNDRGIYKSE